MWTLFHYLYRDAGNYKAFGAIALAGQVPDAERDEVSRHFESGQFFIAEQLGVPALYELLYRWSNGPTNDDHCWHEFERFTEISEPPTRAVIAGRARTFVQRIRSVNAWRLDLSPRFALQSHLMSV